MYMRGIEKSGWSHLALVGKMEQGYNNMHFYIISLTPNRQDSIQLMKRNISRSLYRIRNISLAVLGNAAFVEQRRGTMEQR